MLNLTLIISVQQVESSRPASVFGTLVTRPPNLLKMGFGLSGYTGAFEAFPHA